MADVKMMRWERLLTTKRCGTNRPGKDDRSEFQRDIDRILFCDPFRRLARKAQVHPLNENDHVHSRLTHSLEVSSVGRSLGEAVGLWLKGEGRGLPEDILPHHLGQVVQAACLAHDIGNPPFGHSGEAAIKKWFLANPAAIASLSPACRTDFTKFDGNAMAVRILVNTGFYGEGMSPTLAVLGALLKYPWPSGFDAGKDKFSYFQTEASTVETAAQELGLPDLGGRFARHPLAYLMEAADDICYRIIDIEDATEVGILEPDFMFQAYADMLGIDKEEDRPRYDFYAQKHYRQRNSMLRSKLIGRVLDEMLATFQAQYEPIMTGEFDHASSLMEASEGPVSERILGTYRSIRERLFLSRRKAVLELGAQNSIGSLLGEIMKPAGHFCTDTPSAEKEKVKILLGRDLIEKIETGAGDCPYRVTMAALDYVTGMSDHYATQTCRKLLGLGF